MGSHILDILRQGIWASLAGGWFYDPQQRVFCNTFHLYLWAVLLTFPLVVFATTEQTFLGWSLYCALIGILFTVVKFINFKLHHLFDTGEAEEEAVSEDGANDNVIGKEQGSKGGGDASQENEYIEMCNLGTPSISADLPVTSSKASLVFEREDPLSPSLAATISSKPGKAPLAQEEGLDISVLASLGSRNADDDSPDEEIDSPHTFITKAEIEHTPLSSSDILNANDINIYIKAPPDIGHDSTEKNESLPEHVEESDLLRGIRSKIEKQGGEIESLPASETVDINSIDIQSSSGRTNDLNKATEKERQGLRIRRKRNAIRRSKSSQEWMKNGRQASRAKLSSHSLNMPSVPEVMVPAAQHSPSSNSDWSEISFGEVEIPDESSASYEPVNLFMALGNEALMLSSLDESSGSTVVATSCSLGQCGRPGSPHSCFLPSLIDTSSSSSAVQQEESVSSSPLVYNIWPLNHGDVDSDTSTGGGDTASPSTDTSSSVNFDHNHDKGTCRKELDLKGLDLTSNSPSAENLAVLKSQGAIPKHVKSRGSQDRTITKESTSPGSTDLSDPEEIQRRLLEILWEPHEHTEEVRQLQQIVKMKKNLSSAPPLKPPSSKEKIATGAINGEGEPPEDDSKNLTSQENDRKSSTTPTEFSALLPANPRINQSSNRVARRRRGLRSQQLQRKDSLPIEALSMVVGDEGHIAYSHDDTTDGAVHWFQDEQGNWMSYTFGEQSTGTASDLVDVNANATPNVEIRRPREADNGSLSSNNSNSTVIIEESPNADQSSQPPTEVDELEPGLADMHFGEDLLQDYVQHLLRANNRRNAAKSSTDSDTTNANLRAGPKPKLFYKFWLWPFKLSIKIRFDRLALLAALDRNISVIENVVSVMLAMGVGALGALMITSNFYHDLCLLLFCFIMAGCQYSLLKSVQPDAASPMHGYNRVIVFSRPFYFCLFCSIVLLLDSGSKTVQNKPIYLYGIPFTITSALTFLRNFFRIFILFFPVLFTLGLMPQVNTFLMYMLEQIDMHVFGGNATTSLTSSFYCVCRSCLSVLLLYGFAYASLKNIGKGDYKCGPDMENGAQTVPFSILCGLMVSLSYHLSRSASDPGVLWMLLKSLVFKDEDTKSESEPNKKDSTELIDPLPGKLRDCLKQRIESDGIVCIAVTILVFAVHVSTAFTSPALHPVLSDVLYLIAASVGFLVHYIIPQTRKEMPWLCCSHPLLRSKEWMFYEVKDAPKMMWIERLYLSLRFLERNVIYPVVCLCATTTSAPSIICKFGNLGGPMIILVCSMKMLRFAFSDSPRQYPIITFTYFFFKYDFQLSSETFLIDYFFISILMCKFCDFLLKLNFIITYIAPWQITWGSAFHAFAQPFSVPHSAMLFLQATVSAIFSTPLNPFLGSAIFFTSYVRPVKFWERDYNTKRVDHTNTRLASQLERNPGADDNNLNSIFYEHLTRSLQHSLCGDLLLGRWGNYTQGDCFIMASDYLNALVHIIEVGNGLVTFQLRGLEFRGTYCQQREVEAITEGLEDNGRFCCCMPGHLPHFLSVNAAFNQRWLAWEVVVSRYILEGYSISDNSAATMLQVWELRKALITYYIKSIIYYTVRSPNLENWLENATIRLALQDMDKDSYVDLDPTFNYHIDEDFDSRLKGISRCSFCQTYLGWIQHCANRRDKAVDSRKPSILVSLCFSLSLLGRRALNAASQNSASVDFFLFGLHALFKGDFRIQSPRDEWVFADMDMIRRVVAPAVRMSLKLHQDHFTCPDEYDDSDTLYTAITEHERTMVISHEADPAWRNAVLSNVPSLLALRHVFDEGTDEYKIIMLNKRYLGFRIVKVNRECVRGLWAGQQQELIFLRNRNPERGSIQNAKQALRNMINSSCDQPIGYPIYVSPLTTSYATTHDQLKNMPIVGEEFRFSAVRNLFTSLWNRVRQRCDATCAGGSASFDLDHPYSVSHQMAAASIGCTPRQGLGTQTIDIPLQPIGNRGSLISTASSASKVNTLASLANLTSLISDSSVKDNLPHRVRIIDPNQVYDAINLGRRIEVQWPNEDWKTTGGKSGWRDWLPKKGMEGTVVHKWIPGHPDPSKRSHTDKTILLVQIRDHFVPISETGVFDLGAEV